MFSGNKGAKGGKRDLKISFLNKKKKKKQKELELEKEKAKKSKQQEKRKEIKTKEIKPIDKEEIIFTPRRKRKVGLIVEERKKQEEKQIILEKDKKEEIENQVKETETKTKKIEEEIQEKQTRKKVGITQQEPDKETKQLPKNQEEPKETPIIQEEPKETPIIQEEKESLHYQQLNYAPKQKKNQTPKTTYQEENNEAFLELKVMKEIENLLKENQYQLDKLITEYQILEQESEELIYLKDAENMSLEIDDLLTRLEKIKRQIEVLIETTDLENIYQLEDHYFTYLIDHYKTTVKQETIKDKVDDMKHNPDYISIIQKIIEFEKERDFLQLQVEEKVKTLELRDKDFDQLKTTYLNIEKTSEYLKNLIKDAEQHLKEIQEKVNQAVHVTERVETQMKYSVGLLTRTLLLIQLTKKMPLKQTIGINAIETIVAMNLIHNLLKPKQIQKVIKECDIKDHQTEIIRAINNTDSVYQLVEESLTSIKDLKKTFQKDFSEYQDSIPEYKELLDMIEKTESTMKEKKNEMKRIQNDMNYQLEKNNEKVKRYEEII